jgi:hypothetical protein
MKGQGKNLYGDDVAKFFNNLNMMVDSWGAERQLCWTVQAFSYPLIVGTRSYLIGPTAPAPFNQPRPVTIQSWGVIIPGGSPPLELSSKRVLTADEYNSIALKDLPNAFPLEIYYDYGTPNGTISVYPVTSSGGNILKLYIPMAMSFFTALTDVIFTGPTATPTLAIPNFPPGYWQLLVHNLAVYSAADFGRAVPSEVAGIAARTMQKLKSRNIYVPSLEMPFRQRTAYDYLSDGYLDHNP